MKLLELRIKNITDYFSALYQRTLGSVIVMEWNYLQKSVLLHAFTVLLFLSYVVYMAGVLLHPAWHQYIQVDLFRILVWKEALIALLAAILGMACYCLQGRSWALRYLPSVSIIFFAVAMCSTGYEVGAMSPATGIFLMGTSLIGLALFPRFIVLCVTICAAMVMMALAYAGVVGWIPYAPMFSNHIFDPKLSATFYFYSMLYFILPPAAILMLGTDLVLKQWHQRGREVTLLSQLDPLTGLYNRRTINEHLGRLLAMSVEEDQISILILDLDHFKQVNDTYGHMVGDEVLRQVGHVLQSTMRKSDLAGRFGGEEFIIVLYRSASDVGISVAERIRAKIANIRIPICVTERIQVTTSIGIASFSPYGMTCIDHVLSQADQALYKAKHGGRNRVVHYDQLLAQPTVGEPPADPDVIDRELTNSDLVLD